MELVHNFSLIHDDVEDGDETRRHRATVWKLWGVPQAINAGDGMDVLSYIALLELSVGPQTIVEILKVFNGMVMQLCEGQHLDLTFQARQDVTIDEYLRMITGKTAALIEASTTIGAMVATDDQEIISHFKAFGQKIGIGFQIQDDLLGIWGDQSETGKSSRNDLRNKKKSLPVLYAMHHSPQRDELKMLYTKELLSESDIDRIYEILTTAGAYDYTQQMAIKYRDEALAELDRIHPKNLKALEDLRLISRFLVDRDY